MNTRDLCIFFVVELLAIPIAATAFAVLPSHLIAGGVAGGYFVLSGLYMLGRALRWTDKWKSLTWYVLWVHVAGVALPMLFTRFTHTNLPFAQVRIWGIFGPEFHKISTAVFSILIAATALDWFRARLQRRKITPS